MSRNGCVQSDFGDARAACTRGMFSPAPFHGCVIPWGFGRTSEVSGKRGRSATANRFALRAGHFLSSVFVFPSLSLKCKLQRL